MMLKLLSGMMLIFCCVSSSYAEEPINLQKLHQTIRARGKHRHSCSHSLIIPGPQGLPGLAGIVGPTGAQGESNTIPTTRVSAYGYASLTTVPTNGRFEAFEIVTYDTSINPLIDAETGIATINVTGNYLIKFAISVAQPISDFIIPIQVNYGFSILVNGELIQEFPLNLPVTRGPEINMSNSLAGQIVYALAPFDTVSIQNTAATTFLFSSDSSIIAYFSLEKIN